MISLSSQKREDSNKRCKPKIKVDAYQLHLEDDLSIRAEQKKGMKKKGGGGKNR